jgi:hypothetical protein
MFTGATAAGLIVIGVIEFCFPFVPPFSYEADNDSRLSLVYFLRLSDGTYGGWRFTFNCTRLLSEGGNRSITVIKWVGVALRVCAGSGRSGDRAG